MTNSNDIPEYGSPGAEGGPSAKERQDAKQAWSEAGDRLSGLGGKLRSHYESQAADTSAGGAELKEAAKRLGEAVETAFHAIGAAAKDKSVQDDVKSVGRSVADALAGTFAGLSDEMKKTFGNKQATGSPASSPTSTPAPAPTSTPTSTPSSTEVPPPATPSAPSSTASANPPADPDYPPPGATS